jgi:hypothetical protein
MVPTALRTLIPNQGKNQSDGTYTGLKALMVNWLPGNDRVLRNAEVYGRRLGRASETISPLTLAHESLRTSPPS